MRNLLPVIIFFIFFSFQTLYVQDSSRFSFLLKLHPLPAIDPNRFQIMGSEEFLFSNKIGIELGYGKRYSEDAFYIERKVDMATTTFSGETMFIEATLYNPFGKILYFNKRKFYSKTYVGLVYRYFYDITNKMKYYSPLTDSMFHKDCFAVKRSVQIFLFKVGYLIRYKRIGFDFYAGLGLRHKKQTFLNNELDANNDSFSDGIWFFEKPFDGYLPSINVGIKISYKIFGWK